MTSRRAVQEFTFQLSGTHSSGRAFTSEFLVVAASEAEARDALSACLVDDPSISASGVPTLRSCTPASQPSVVDYERAGAFTIFDPDLGLAR